MNDEEHGDVYMCEEQEIQDLRQRLLAEEQSHARTSKRLGFVRCQLVVSRKVAKMFCCYLEDEGVSCTHERAKWSWLNE